jgi:hypothetical protein
MIQRRKDIANAIPIVRAVGPLSPKMIRWLDNNRKLTSQLNIKV